MKKKHIISEFKKLLRYAEQQPCLHEDTYRGGAIWEICRDCDMKWADDEGGKPDDAHELPKEILDAHRVLEFLD